MYCEKCCISCHKGKKTCEARKERERTIKRAVYKTKKGKQIGGETS
jgi:hypothetical protein